MTHLPTQYGGEMSVSQVYLILEQAGFYVPRDCGEGLLRNYEARETNDERRILMMSAADVKRLLEDLKTGKLVIRNPSDVLEKIQ